MDATDIGVIVGGIATLAFITWFFFGQRRGELARLAAGGVQEVDQGTLEILTTFGSPARPRANSKQLYLTPNGRSGAKRSGAGRIE